MFVWSTLHLHPPEYAVLVIEIDFEDVVAYIMCEFICITISQQLIKNQIFIYSLLCTQ